MKESGHFQFSNEWHFQFSKFPSLQSEAFLAQHPEPGLGMGRFYDGA